MSGKEQPQLLFIICYQILLQFLKKSNKYLIFIEMSIIFSIEYF